VERERTAPIGEATRAEDEAGIARVARLPQLVDAVAHSSGDDRAELATELNDLLVAMRAPGQEAAESAVVQLALSGKKLHGVVDTRNRSCRKEAVETLLATGFPYALEVTPEDLAFARAYRPKVAGDAPNEWKEQMGQRRQGAAIFATGGSAITVVWQLVEMLRGDPGLARGGSVLLAVLMAWVTIAFSRRRADTSDQGTFGTAIAVAGLLQIICVAVGGWAGVPALAGAVLAFATLFAGEDTELRDRRDGY
jgi:hypothetical protein